jgi:ribosome modulation factor
MQAIRKGMEHERGYQAGLRGHIRASPDDCLDRSAWLEGFDLGAKLKPPPEAKTDG